MHKLPLVMSSFQPFLKNPSNKSSPVNSRVSCQHSCIKIKIRQKLRITQRRRWPNISQAVKPREQYHFLFLFLSYLHVPVLQPFGQVTLHPQQSIPQTTHDRLNILWNVNSQVGHIHVPFELDRQFIGEKSFSTTSPANHTGILSATR